MKSRIAALTDPRRRSPAARDRAPPRRRSPAGRRRPPAGPAPDPSQASTMSSAASRCARRSAWRPSSSGACFVAPAGRCRAARRRRAGRGRSRTDPRGRGPAAPAARVASVAASPPAAGRGHTRSRCRPCRRRSAPAHRPGRSGSRSRSTSHVDELGARDGPDPQRLASRPDGRQDPRRLIGHQHEHVAAGRLLERLEERVLRLLVGPVDPLDQDHPPLAGDRRTGAVGEPAARRGHDALPGGSLLPPPLRRPDDEVRVGPRPRLAAAEAGVAGSLAVSRLAEEQRQQVVDEGALAAARGTVDEQRPLEATTGRRALHDRPRGRLPEAQKARRGGHLGHGRSIGSAADKPAITSRSGRSGDHADAPPNRPGTRAGGRPATGSAAPSGGRRGAIGRLMPYFEHAPNLRTKEMPAMADQVTTSQVDGRATVRPQGPRRT